MKKTIFSTVLMASCAFAVAKLPPLDDAAKAKGAEAAARASWQAKGDAFQLCKVQDNVAAHYRKTAAVSAAQQAVAVPGGSVAAAAFVVSPGSAPGAAPSTAPSTVPSAAPGASPVAANPAVPGGTAANAAGPATPTPCADPGPFAYNPVQQTPLEASGAHSPAGNAISPPSVNTPAASMTPAKKP